jgi:hypothetical protein
MSNPWLKKNPFMSLWLSGANTVANRARGQASAAAKRQSATVARQAGTELMTLWAGLLTPAPVRKRRKRR